MERRTYLRAVWVAGVTGIAGCTGDDGDGDSDGTTTETTTEETTETTTEETTETTTEETTEDTSTPQPATFEIVSVDAPDRIAVFEDHQISITVQNVGDESGTFTATLQISIEGNPSWEDVGTIELEDVPPGETETWESGSFSFEDPYQLQYRLAEYDIAFAYEVVLPDPEISLGASEIVSVDVGYEVRPMAEVEVYNGGNLPTKRLAVTADWLDETGSYLASSEGRLQTLGADETWVARIDPLIDIDNYNDIADVEVNIGQVETATSIDPEGVTLVDEQLRASSEQVIVRGSVRNDRDTQLGYLEVVAKVYNAAADVIGYERTNELDIGAGQMLRFELGPDTHGRDGLVQSHEVVLSDSTLSF